MLDLLEPDPALERYQESGIGRREDRDGYDLGGYTMTVNVRYTMLLGIIFPWRRKSISTGSRTARPRRSIWCLSTITSAAATRSDRTNAIGHQAGNDDVYQSYQGSRPLNAVHLRAQFHGEVKKSGVTSRWHEISVNRPVDGLPPAGLDYPHNPSSYSVGQYSVSRPTLARGPVTSWSITPALPPGLTILPATGVIEGVPTASAPAAARTVTASNGWGSTTKLLQMAPVGSPPPPSNLGYPGNPLIYVKNEDVLPVRPTISGGKPTSWTVTPALPPGLSLIQPWAAATSTAAP